MPSINLSRFLNHSLAFWGNGSTHTHTHTYIHTNIYKKMHGKHIYKCTHSRCMHGHWLSTIKPLSTANTGAQTQACTEAHNTHTHTHTHTHTYASICRVATGTNYQATAHTQQPHNADTNTHDTLILKEDTKAMHSEATNQTILTNTHARIQHTHKPHTHTHIQAHTHKHTHPHAHTPHS